MAYPRSTRGGALRAHTGLWRYALAVVSIAAALVVRESLLPDAGDRSPFLVFVLAVLVSAVAGGLGPGLSATALGLCVGVYLYLPPFHELSVDTPEDIVRVVLFLVTGVAVTIAGSMLRRAIRRERALALGARRFDRFLRRAATAPPLGDSASDVPAEQLSDRETEVVRLLALGLSNEEIAAAMFVSRNTVKTHLSHAYGKLGVRTRTAAVARCIDLGWLAGGESTAAPSAEKPAPVGDTELVAEAGLQSRPSSAAESEERQAVPENRSLTRGSRISRVEHAAGDSDAASETIVP